MIKKACSSQCFLALYVGEGRLVIIYKGVRVEASLAFVECLRKRFMSAKFCVYERCFELLVNYTRKLS